MNGSPSARPGVENAGAVRSSVVALPPGLGGGEPRGMRSPAATSAGSSGAERLASNEDVARSNRARRSIPDLAKLANAARPNRAAYGHGGSNPPVRTSPLFSPVHCNAAATASPYFVTSLTGGLS